MKLGICAGLESAPALREAGWDYVEGSVQALFCGLEPDEAWTMLEPIRSAAVPVLAANLLVPAPLKVTGSSVDGDRLRRYMTHVLDRAGRCGTRMLVFGSGGARQVPDGFDKSRAEQQIVETGRMIAPIAERHGVTVVLEPLHGGECNIVNSVAEAMQCVRAVAHPSFQCLVDSYHLWMQGEPLDAVRDAGAHVRHVHLADRDGRVAPGESKSTDYRPLFRVLKDIGYDGLMSVEGSWPGDPAVMRPRVLGYLREQWAAA